MRRSTDARGEILRAIRQHLAASAAHDERRATAPHGTPMLPVLNHAGDTPTQTAPDAPDDLALRFAQQLHTVGARCTAVRDEAEAACVVSQILRDENARDVVASDATVVRRLLERAQGEYNVREIGETSQKEL